MCKVCALIYLQAGLSWGSLTDGESLVRLWVAAASAVAYIEEVCQNVLNALLQIASQDRVMTYIPVDLWLWLTKRPSLPPTCLGYYFGAHSRVAEAVTALKDIEILKSYLLIVWSEWSARWLNDPHRIYTLVREIFCGIEMGRNRADLVQRLDQVLGQLDRGSEYLK